ncbi:MAG: hypothetical protein KAG94_06595 [Clostridiales bacterium]|nr:hypothetical protein [Clostridiales bacterium]
MFKHNMKATREHFDLWWKRTNKLPILSINYPFTKFSYENIDDFTNADLNIKYFTDEHSKKTFNSDCFPDISSYLGPGSLATFLGATPVYGDNVIWYDGDITSSEQIINAIKNPTKWYQWSIETTKKYVNNITDYRVSMPDLQQNLDILSALYTPEELLMKLIDDEVEVFELLELLYEFWDKCFFKHANLVMDDKGYTSFGHYNILGKGYTSTLQSDISIMLSEDMFDSFEMPYLIRQCERLDNVLYHLDGPGAIRHLDSLLSIDKIAAIQWVPGAGQPDNFDKHWYQLYDKILKNGKGIHVYLAKENVVPFLKRFGSQGVYITTMVRSEEDEIKLLEAVDKII